MSNINKEYNYIDIKITVGIVTYNRRDFLREAVASVLGQSYVNFELIISNDYVDSEVSLATLEVENDPRIKIINQVNNLGETDNMNYLLNSAKSDWFVWLADDDLLHPEFLMLATRAILDEKKNSNLVGYFSNYRAGVDPDGIFPKPITPECLIKTSTMNTREFFEDYTARKKLLIGCYGVMHTETLKKIGGMPKLGDSFGPYSDNLIPILLSEYGNISWVDKELIFLRTHSDSLSCKSTDFHAYTSAEVDFLDNFKAVCKNVSLNSNQLYIANMVVWFAENELAVLGRIEEMSKYSAVKKFSLHQIMTNIPRLSFKYKLQHLMFSFFLILNFAVFRPVKRYIRVFI